jgi:hypothetical protein
VRSVPKAALVCGDRGASSLVRVAQLSVQAVKSGVGVCKNGGGYVARHAVHASAYAAQHAAYMAENVVHASAYAAQHAAYAAEHAAHAVRSGVGKCKGGAVDAVRMAWGGGCHALGGAKLFTLDVCQSGFDVCKSGVRGCSSGVIKAVERVGGGVRGGCHALGGAARKVVSAVKELPGSITAGMKPAVERKTSRSMFEQVRVCVYVCLSVCLYFEHICIHEYVYT